MAFSCKKPRGYYFKVVVRPNCMLTGLRKELMDRQILEQLRNGNEALTHHVIDFLCDESKAGSLFVAFSGWWWLYLSSWWGLWFHLAGKCDIATFQARGCGRRNWQVVTKSTPGRSRKVMQKEQLLTRIEQCRLGYIQLNLNPHGEGRETETT